MSLREAVVKVLVDDRAGNGLVAEHGLRSGIDRGRFAPMEGTAKRARMPPAARAALSRVPREKIHEVDRPVFISKNIGLTGPIPRETLYEDTGGPFFSTPREGSPIQSPMILPSGSASKTPLSSSSVAPMRDW